MIGTGSPRNRRAKTICLALICALALGWAQGVAPAAEKSFLQAGPEDVQAWRELKFGLFVHWGPVSLKGTEIG